MGAANGLPVTVSASVLEGLEAVKQSGNTDMIDAREVQALAYIMGYQDAAWWIEYFPNLYDAGLIHGFMVVE